MHKLSWTARIAVATIIALVAAGCGGDDSSGLATLQGVTTTAPDEAFSAAGVDEPASAASATQGSDGTAAGAAVDDAAADMSGADETDADVTDADKTDADKTDAHTTAGDDRASADEVDDLTDEERLLEFAQCMRDNGVDFPDPVVEADGTIAFGLRPGRGGGGQGETLQNIGRDPDLPAARAACEGIIEGVALGPGRQNSDDFQVELMDRLLEFAQCMRDNGVDVPDPDPSAFGPGSGGGLPFGGIDFDDADVSAAFEICGEYLPARPGRGGGQ